MSLTLTSRLLAAGATLALAVPGAALAHGGDHHRNRDGVHCAALKAGRTPQGVTAEQATALIAACDARAAAVKAANTAFLDATKAPRADYRAALTSIRTDY